MPEAIASAHAHGGFVDFRSVWLIWLICDFYPAHP
jgi:hypothetical protein